MKRQNFKYYLAGLVALTTFAVYLATLRNAFVAWDDNEYVFENPYIRLFNPAFLRWAFFDFYAANWHPLTWISHALDYAIWGLNPMGHHLTSIILHAVNTFLVVLLVVRLIEAVRGKQPSSSQVVEWPGNNSTTQRLIFSPSHFSLIAAGVTGLLFGLHPIHVESVAWVAERKDLLCALFYLLSVMAYTKHVTGTMQSAEGAHSEKDNAPSTARKDQKTVFSMHHAFASMVPALFFFALALLSKPMAVSLPVVLLILDWYPFNKIYSLKTFRTALVEKLPFFILSIASSAVTILAQNAAGAIRSVDIIPLSSRVIIAARSLIAYIWKMLAPFELIPLYTYPRDISLFSPNYFLPIIFVAGITLACIIAIKSQKLWISVWGYYVVALIPVLGIVQVGGQAMADRYTYLPGLGPFLVAGLFAAWSWEKLQPLNKRRPAIKFAVAVAAIFIFVSMTYLTVRQIGIWKDDMTLWSYVIEKEPAKVNLAYYMRGQVYQEQGYLEKAMADYNMVNALEPFHFEVYCSRASIFEKMGQPDKAIKDYSMAIAINPRAEEALIRRGILYGKAGQFDKAMEDFNRAIDINPGNPPAYVSRGTAYFRLGQNSKALADFSKAIELDQNYAGVYVNRGSLYLNTGNKEQALSDYRKACSLGNQEGCDALRALQN